MFPALALATWAGTLWLGGGFWLVLLGVLVFLQRQRTIERVDLLILAAVTLAIVAFVPELKGTLTILEVALLGIGAAAAVVFVTVLFRSIYKLLSALF